MTAFSARPVRPLPLTFSLISHLKDSIINHYSKITWKHVHFLADAAKTPRTTTYF